MSSSDDLERRHFQKIIAAFQMYRGEALRNVAHAECQLANLSPEQQSKLPHRAAHFRKLRTAVEHNSRIIDLILQDAQVIFENMPVEAADSCEPVQKPLAVTGDDLDKVRSTLKQFVRDWSSEGEPERQSCYTPVVQEICERLPVTCEDQPNRVLVPGAGLGRLAWEIAKCGYVCQGNEWSLFMLFASYFVLNKCNRVNHFFLYPWIHQNCNVWRREDQLRSAAFPDVNPAELTGSNFSMAAGDFLEVYRERNSWDCVATVYFIDTAHNIVQYVETIWKILRPGGFWINMGPLLWHFSGMAGEESVEISYEDLREVIELVGFKFLKEELGVRSSYTQNHKSMLTYEYSCAFFVVQKPDDDMEELSTVQNNCDGAESQD